MAKKKNMMEQMKNFWGSVVEDEEISIQHRLKASELLVKIQGEGEESGVVVISGEDELED